MTPVLFWPNSDVVFNSAVNFIILLPSVPVCLDHCYFHHSMFSSFGFDFYLPSGHASCNWRRLQSFFCLFVSALHHFHSPHFQLVLWMWFHFHHHFLRILFTERTEVLVRLGDDALG